MTDSKGPAKTDGKIDGAMPQSFLDLSFHERRYICVVSDHEFASRASAQLLPHQSPAEQSGSSIWPAVSLIAPILVPGGVLVRGLVLAGGIAYTAYATRNDPTNKTDTKNIGRDLIVEVPVVDTRGLTFPRRYAEVGRLYALDPLNTRNYYHVQSYEDDMILNKLSELELILCSLGAKRFEIKYAEDDSNRASAGISSSALPVNGNTSLSISRKRRFERSGTSDGREPSLPDGLTWYHQEADWQTLAHSRLHYGRKEFSFSVELERGFELTAKAVAAFESLGVDFGADYNRQRNLTLVVSGTF